jgi:branched-chain amino acid transport system ATP-binding protein
MQPAPAILAVDGLNVDIGAANILRNVTLSIPAGMMCGLIGRNGAGKTTLMRSIMGLVPARSGHIAFAAQDFGAQDFAAQDLRAMAAFKRAHLGIGYMPEDRRLMPHLSSQENILLPAWITGMSGSPSRLQWIYELMPEVEKFSARHANQLSGGQQKLLALARALMCGTKLLLLDEPFEGLAPALARRLAEVLTRLKTEGLSVFMAESNETHVRDLFDQVFLIERGSIAPRS